MKSKESIKSITLVVLFITSLILSSQIFFRIESESISDSNSVVWIERKENINDYFSPQSYFVNFGGSLHTVIYNLEEKREITNIVSNCFKNLVDYNSFVEIDYNKWQEGINQRGIRFNMNFDIEFDDFISLLINDNIEFDSKWNVSEVNIVADENIYIRSGSKYYSFNNINREIDKFENVIAEIENSYLEYKSIEEIYSLNSILDLDSGFKSNNNLIPIIKVADIPIIEVVNEVDIKNEKSMIIKSYVGRILGKNFIRKVYDYEGSVIYMIGYGEKSLKIDNNGYFEYNEKLLENNNKLTFAEGLNMSINALSTINNLPGNTYISNYYKYNKDENEITRYEFDYSYGGYEVLLNDKDESAFVIEFNGSQLSYISRRYKKFTSLVNVNKIWESALPINMVINKNYEVISKNYLNDKGVFINLTNNEYIYEILQNIKGVEIKYYLKAADGEEKLVPVWELEIGKWTYFINIYDGVIVSSIDNEVNN